MTHLRIELNTITENITSNVIHKLYETAKAIIDAEEANDVQESLVSLKGNLLVPISYRAEVTWLLTKFPDLHITSADYAIPFEDPNMLSYLLNKGIGSNGYITEDQAAAVTSVSNAPNTTITKFNEFKYFTNITESKGGFSGSVDGNMRFHGWTALEEIDVSNLTTIGHNNGYGHGDTFVNCTSLKKVTASSNLTKLGYNAFNGCTNLETLSGLDGVVEIWDNAFSNCEKLPLSFFQSLQFTLKTSGPGYNFNGCKLLSSINISDATTEIPKYCFYGCTNLSSISIPSTVTKVNSAAFYNCASLTDVDIDWTKITEIGREAFRECSNLVIQNMDCSNLTAIGDYAFLNCSNLQSAVIPNTITKIPRSCFDGCSNLTTVTLPSTITIIDREGFLNCSNITTINTTNVTEIWYNAFKNCTQLLSVDLSNCTKIYSNAFNNCTALTSIGSLSSMTRLEDYAFIGCRNIVGLINMPNLTYLGGKAFYGCKKITLISIPSTITNYGESLFRESGITSFTIPSGVRVGPVVFRDCKDLQTVVIGSNTGVSCFSGCSSLSNVTILEGVTELEDQSFRDTVITIIDLPSTITSIGGELFSGCSLLNTIIIRATTPPTGDRWYFGLNTNATIYVPDASVNDYKASTAFSALSSRVFGISQLPNS